ncbi:MAG: FIST signal transduction protein [Velocimicrobium sp.]
MKIEQLEYYSGQFYGEETLGKSAQWVLIFGSGVLLRDNRLIDCIRNKYPNAYLMGCSTAGEIHADRTNNDSLSITAIEFMKVKVKFKSYPILCNTSKDSFEFGKQIISELDQNDLKHVFILSEGLNFNASKLVEGMREIIKKEVPLTGGLAGDGTQFKETYIISNDYAKRNQIVVAALYGSLKNGCASVGGWDTFGIERIVTKSKENILYEMDHKPALDLYKEYLGERATELPASGLLFPLSVRLKEAEEGIVRSVLSINEEDKSLIFAGDIPENSYCKLMRSNYNNLLNGSMKAAELASEMIAVEKIDLAILISCVGRKAVFKQRLDEEIEVIRDIVGKDTIVTGFYSYGEIAPYRKDTLCELHNQTMTVTFITEE